jgi:hypothetical protein
MPRLNLSAEEAAIIAAASLERHLAEHFAGPDGHNALNDLLRTQERLGHALHLQVECNSSSSTTFEGWVMTTRLVSRLKEAT